MTATRFALLLSLLAVSAVAPGGAAPGQSPGRRVIEITAERFEFWPSEIVLALGPLMEMGQGE